jgi:hypothetical protein
MARPSASRRRGALLCLLTGLAVAAGSAAAFAQIPEPDKCGVGQAAPPPRPASTRADEDRERQPPGVRPTNFLPGAPATELPAPTTAALPASPNPTATQAPPAGGAPPPAVPGLVPPKKDADESNRKRIEARQAKGEIPEARLLDVGIEVFAPGVDEGDRQKLAKVGLSPELRKSEARYIAFHLKKTLESTGYWGTVRVLPGPGEGIDLTVTGRIRESNGKRLALTVEAKDAAGQKWLDRRYTGSADTSAYKTERVGRQESFQEVYNRIANDLLETLSDRSDEQLATVRQIAGLRFASQILPEAFSPYLKSSDSGRFNLTRLPATEDPMLRRVASIRERDQMLVDTLNDHYLTFYEQMSGPYSNWKMYSYDEQSALDKINRESMWKKLLGGAALLTGLLMSPDSHNEAALRDAAMIGGGLLMQSGFQKAQEKGVHQAALKELATSFDGDVAPLLIEVEGQQVKLTGPAETQFAAWRSLLRQVMSLETGATTDPNAVLVMTPSAQASPQP